MTRSLQHRGPDDEDFYFNDKASFGFRRLSVIDIQKGKQPMLSEDENVVIVFNGEIYNFQEIRKELERLGHAFKTRSDTEVLLHAYLEYGFECLRHLNGMFAFCIYDKSKDLLFLARDRFGIKPLYFFWNSRRFIFASEIKAILVDRTIPRICDEHLVYDYLQNGRIQEAAETTFFKSIRKLKPSHFAVLKEGRLKMTRYFRIADGSDQADCLDENISLNRFSDLLTDSVRFRLISDVPVGTCLSGGLDSSSIISIMSSLKEKNLPVSAERQKAEIMSFSAVFPGTPFDESRYVHLVANKFGLVKNLAIPTAESLWKDLEKLVYHQEEPFETTSVYAQFCVMREAGTKVKVVLDGQGADEVMAGYQAYFLIYLKTLLKEKRIIRFLLEAFAGIPLLLKLARMYSLQRAEKHLVHTLVQCQTEASKSKDFKTLSDRLLHDTNNSLCNVLRYEDKNSMAFSVEARLPFLDYRLVQLVFSLPDTLKIRRGKTKYMLRQCMKDKLPSVVLKRAKKGFETPENLWLVRNKESIISIFSSPNPRSQKFVQSSNFISAFKRYCDNKYPAGLSRVFWRILNLEVWMRVFDVQTD